MLLNETDCNLVNPSNIISFIVKNELFIFNVLQYLNTSNGYELSVSLSLVINGQLSMVTVAKSCGVLSPPGIIKLVNSN